MKPGFSEETMKSRFTTRKAMVRADIGKYPNFGEIQNGQGDGKVTNRGFGSESICFLRAVTESEKQ